MRGQSNPPDLDFTIERLGAATIPSPMKAVRFVDDDATVLYHRSMAEIEPYLEAGIRPPAFLRAGPRAHLHFDPDGLRMGMVTCGGLCPGLNDVIRALVLSAYYHYGCTTMLGYRYGYEGLNPAFGHHPLPLTPAYVDRIGDFGGTVLGSSRGEQPVEVMVDTLVRDRISVLFTIGGDGTLRGAQAIHDELARRGLDIAVVGIPKTIDNDISCIQQSFGFQTAAEEAYKAVASANTEATGVNNGIGLVKLMGRESGFIAAYTAMVDSMVNFCLIPEVPFALPVFLRVLEERIRRRHHAVISVAEGAGQALFTGAMGVDKSGNLKLGDIGLLLQDAIKQHFHTVGLEVNLKYIDPSYIIRSVPANAFDSAFALVLAHNAVHAAMAGYTNCVVGYWHNEYTLVPIQAATAARKKVDPDGWLWNSVLAATGQPRALL